MVSNERRNEERVYLSRSRTRRKHDEYTTNNDRVPSPHKQTAAIPRTTRGVGGEMGRASVLLSRCTKAEH